MCVYLITTLMCEQAGKVDPDGQPAGPGGVAHSELLPQLPDLGRGGPGPHLLLQHGHHTGVALLPFHSLAAVSLW